MKLADPTFPPLFEGHDVRAPEQPFEHAVASARSGTLGAGDVVWARRLDRVELAVVLEPEVPLSRAMQMVPLAMVATCDCLGVLTPPQVAVTHLWPNITRINGAEAGRIRVAASLAAPGETPDWLVVGLSLTLKHDELSGEPGLQPDQTALAEEGGGELNRTIVIESWSRHFLTWLHEWSESGFRSTHDAWLYRADGRETPEIFRIGNAIEVGTVVGLDEDANLMLRDDEGRIRTISIAGLMENPAFDEQRT